MARRLLQTLVMCGWLVTTLAAGESARHRFNLDREHVPGQLIVKFKEAFIAPAQLLPTITSLSATRLHTFKASGADLIAFANAPSDEALYEAAVRLAKDPRVEYVEANTILHASDVIPNDPKFGELYALHNSGLSGRTAGADIHAVEAWEVTTGSRQVLIGIIDTGMDYHHPDLRPNVWINPGETGLDGEGKDKASNGIDDDQNGYVDDWRGWNFVAHNNDPMDDNQHGTHLAGTIGAQGNDGIGIVGVNWQVSMVPLKFLDAQGSGSLGDAVKAIEYATALGVVATNNSYGGAGQSPTMKAAIAAAGAKGILFVAAASNDGVDNDNFPHYPASYPLANVIAVAATGDHDELAEFSNYGHTTVHLGAPGVNILSSVPGAAYKKLSGTSMATPHVTGAVALIKAAYPDATGAEIKDRLVNSVDATPALDGKTISGGRLNVANALANDLEPPGVAADLHVTHQGITSVQVSGLPAYDKGAGHNIGRYQVRYSPTPIVSEADWLKSSLVSTKIALPEAGSSTFSFTISGLPINSQGFVAVKALSRIGRPGQLSASVPVSVAAARKIYENTGILDPDIKAQASWGVELDPERQVPVFSASPGKRYKPNLNASLTLPAAALARRGAATLLSFDSWTDLERGFDHGHVEISGDGGQSWREVAKLTGTSGWTSYVFDLSSYLQDATSVVARFRISTDYSIDGQGWRLAKVALYAPADIAAGD